VACFRKLTPDRRAGGGIVVAVEVELLVVRDCPNEAAARVALQEAARQAGWTDLAVKITVVDSDREAHRRGFVGSPTFLLNGVDPFAVPGAQSGITCRVYPTVAGCSGVPDVAQLRDALLRGCASRSTATGGR
jgi:hypothetical protein